jgi:putative ATP-dependent endonuclease of OLD family
MELVAFSVMNYRSITKAYRLPIRQSTILIGPNNEGKSNILRALVTSLEFLSRIGGVRIERGRLRFAERYSEFYDWQKDFPISLQSKAPQGETIFNLDFELTDDEIAEFETNVKSKLNGTLPIQLSIGQIRGNFKVPKKGPGGSALSKKRELIAKFISQRINVSYIPAVRTAKSAHEVVGELVERELRMVESDKTYQDALAAVAKVQAPVLKRISTSIKETLKEFLPNVREVKVTIPEEERFRALRRSCEIIVDDGTPTHLSSKGDGVQSLAALSLMRQVPVSGINSRNLILAIEEPESHLHPNAIHHLKSVITDIATKHQVIMTTHCPIFVDRTIIKSNILVHDNKASPARDVKQIREILGVRAADNLKHAEIILVVEGEEDKRALTALLKQNSLPTRNAMSEGTLAIDSLLGGSNLGYKLSQLNEAMCICHSFLDHDKCGLQAAERAQRDGLLVLADITFATCAGMKESEIEDMYEMSIYSTLLQNKYGVSTASPKFKGNAKWSDRTRETFKHHGKPWSDQIEASLKFEVAELVEANPATALNMHKRNSFDALVQALEAKLQASAFSKR